MLFFSKRKTPYVPDDDRLRQVIDILFPPLRTEEMPDGTKMQIDYSVDSNLDAVLIDLEEGQNDEVTRNTIRSCVKSIGRVRTILEAWQEIDLESKFLMVDTPDSKSIDDIVAGDEH